MKEVNVGNKEQSIEEKLLAMSASISKDEKKKIVVKGKTFRIKYPKRIVYDKIVRVGIKYDLDEDKLTGLSGDADVRVASYILLHNPIKIFFFLRVYMWWLKYRYDSETFMAIIDAGINPREIEAFYKSSMSIMSLAHSKKIMMKM